MLYEHTSHTRTAHAHTAHAHGLGGGLYYAQKEPWPGSQPESWLAAAVVDVVLAVSLLFGLLAQLLHVGLLHLLFVEGLHDGQLLHVIPFGLQLALAREPLVAWHDPKSSSPVRACAMCAVSCGVSRVCLDLSEVDEVTRQTLAEVGGMYESALAFR